MHNNQITHPRNASKHITLRGNTRRHRKSGIRTSLVTTTTAIGADGKINSTQRYGPFGGTITASA